MRASSASTRCRSRTALASRTRTPAADSVPDFVGIRPHHLKNNFLCQTKLIFRNLLQTRKRTLPSNCPTHERTSVVGLSGSGTNRFRQRSRLAAASREAEPQKPDFLGI